MNECAKTRIVDATTVKKITFTALMTAVMCILSPLSIPIGPVPITLSVACVFLCVYTLGAKLGSVACGIYILLGLVGLPVFSGFAGGPAKLFGPTGGYIVGKKECIENAAHRLTSPGLGKEVGASLSMNQSLFQGFFLSPTVTCGALKAAVFAANLYERLGYFVVPGGSEKRCDIIQSVELKTADALIAFCKGIQAAAPVDSYVTPEPWDMPGYDSQVIMAAGAFVQGSSIELSADGPLKEPYAVYFQGGLTWYHGKIGILNSLQKLVDANLVKGTLI